MAHPPIAGDAAFAVVLAAWWQRRRSAHLLPHLRRGPSSFVFNPGYGCVSWILAIIAPQPLLTLHRLRRPTRHMATGNGYVRRGAAVPDRTHTPVMRPELRSRPEESGWATAPIPIPVGRRPTRTGVSRSAPGSTSRPSSEPPTCPFPVVGPRSSGQATPSIGPQAGSRAESGSGYVEPPTRTAVARRGSE
jgi:hypothetical protein